MSQVLNAQGNPETPNEFFERLSRESLARGFIEFPQMLHHADGRQAICTSAQQREEILRDGFHLTPTAAQAEKAERDEADRKRAELAIGAESAAAGKKGK